MGQALQKLRSAQHYLTFQSHNLYQTNQSHTFSEEEVIRSLRFAASSNATDYRSLHEVERQMGAIVQYLLGGRGSVEAEEVVSGEGEGLEATGRYVLFTYQKYLEKVVPTNITYYHFMREKEFYTHFVALKYVMVVGIARPLPPLFKMKTHKQLALLRLLLEWLLGLVHYRCSAIYLRSTCVDPLIRQAHLLLAVLLGNPQHSPLSTLGEVDLRQLFNDLMYVEAFLLAFAIPKKDYTLLRTVIYTTRTILRAVPKQKVTTYLPSYLFANLIGFLPAPYTLEVFFRLLAHFLTTQPVFGSDEESVESPEFKQRLICDCWSVLCLLSEEYQLHKPTARRLAVSAAQSLPNQSMLRGFVMGFIRNLNLEVEDEQLRAVLEGNRQPYVYNNCVMRLETFTKNYHILADQGYLRAIVQISKDQCAVQPQGQLWAALGALSKEESPSLEEYLRVRPAAQ